MNEYEFPYSMAEKKSSSTVTDAGTEYSPFLIPLALFAPLRESSCLPFETFVSA